MVKDVEGAAADLEAASKLAPEDKGIRLELGKVRRDQQATEAKLKGTFKRMFS